MLEQFVVQEESSMTFFEIFNSSVRTSEHHCLKLCKILICLEGSNGLKLVLKLKKATIFIARRRDGAMHLSERRDFIRLLAKFCLRGVTFVKGTTKTIVKNHIFP